MDGHVFGSSAALVGFVTLLGPLRSAGAEVFQCDVPTDWSQGRGVWGGLVIAAAVQAAEAATAHLDLGAAWVRSLTGVMAGPWLPGIGTVYTKIVRSGSAVTVVGVELANPDGSVAATVTVVLAAPRESALDVGGPGWQSVPTADVVAALAAGPDAHALVDLAGGPVEYLRHFDFRPINAVPLTGTPQTTILGWGRLRAGEVTVADAAWLAALTDMWWPVALVAATTFRPIATLSFGVDLIADPTTLHVSDWLLGVGRAAGAHEGYVAESSELWSSSGTLLARTNQIITVIK